MGKSGPSSRLGAHAKGWALPSLGMWMWTSWTRQQAHWACWALFHDLHNLPSSVRLRIDSKTRRIKLSLNIALHYCQCGDDSFAPPCLTSTFPLHLRRVFPTLQRCQDGDEFRFFRFTLPRPCPPHADKCYNCNFFIL